MAKCTPQIVSVVYAISLSLRRDGLAYHRHGGLIRLYPNAEYINVEFYVFDLITVTS